MSNTTSTNNNEHICELLATLPVGSTTVTQIQVDDVLVDVSAFINFDREENLVYFTSPIGTTLIVDCSRIALLIF